MRGIILRTILSAVITTVVLMPFNLRAQDCGDVTLGEATKHYELGKFDLVMATLSPCIRSGFNEKQKVEAHRLMAMSYLSIDSLEKASFETALLLQINPNYDPNIFDPPLFKELVNRLKLTDVGMMVTSVSKKAENYYEVPATIAVITRDDIIKRGYNDLVELLKDIPGFDLAMFYGPEYANVYQRGFRQNNTEKTLLLLDGIEENDLWTNWAYIDRQYLLSNIERVEIIYGPASTMYGPNAFAGVINVISRNSTDALKPGRNTGISASLKYGTFNTQTADISVSGKKRSVSYTLSGRLYHSDEHDLTKQKYFNYDREDYNDIDYAKLLNINENAGAYLTANNLPFAHPYYQVTADTSQLTLTPEGIEAARNLDKSAYDQIVLGSKVGFTNNTDSWLINGKMSAGNFSMGFQVWKYQRGGLTQYTDMFVMVGPDNGTTWAPSLSNFFTKYENQLSDKMYLSNLTTYRIHAVTEDSRLISVLNYARGNRKLTDLIKGTPPAWSTSFLYSQSKQLRNELKLNYTPNSRLDVITGFEVRNSTLQGAYYTSSLPTPMDSAVINPSPKGGNSFNVWDLGLYSQATYQALRDLKVTLGLRYDYNVVRNNGGFGSEFSPRVAIVYSPDMYTFKAIYSQGIMNVSNWTKYSEVGNRIPNPTLNVEKIQNIELSAGIRPTKEFQADIAVYRNYVFDVVGTVNAPDRPGKVMNDNIGQFTITGLQSTAQYRTNTFGVWFNYTFCDPRQTYAETGEVNNTVGDIAAHQFNIGANKLFFNNLNVNLRANYSGKRLTGPGTTVPLNNDSFPSTFIINSAITYQNPALVRGLSLQLVCNNILNTVYYHPGTKAAEGITSPTSILQKGRHFLVTLSYDF